MRLARTCGQLARVHAQLHLQERWARLPTACTNGVHAHVVPLLAHVGTRSTTLAHRFCGPVLNGSQPSSGLRPVDWGPLVKFCVL